MKKISLSFFATKEIDVSQTGNLHSGFSNPPDRLVYGFEHDDEFTLTVSAKRNSLLQLLWKPFEKFLIYRTGVGFRLDQVIINLKQIRSQDIVLAQTDSCGLPIVLLKKLNLIKCKVGFLSAGLINNLELQQNTFLFRFYKWFLKEADFIVCWSLLEEKMYKELIGVNAKFVLLETDLDFYQPNFEIELEDYVLCVGRDVGRDFQSLFQVLEELNIPAKVITQPNRIKGLEVPKNVELYLEKVSYPTLLDWYKKARLVVINLQEINRFTGQRALLEALAMGKGVVAAKTKALTETYVLEDGNHLVYYEPGNKEDLKEKISVLYRDEEKIKRLKRNARQFVESLPKDSFFRGVKKILLDAVTYVETK